MTVCVFPGQGSQWVGMGKALFERYDTLVQKANAILGFDLTALCLHDPHEQLDNTLYTQPALFVVNALSWQQWRETNSTTVHFLAGHSLGEYNALLAAGVFDFETGLRLVLKRAQLSAEIRGGGMAAVVGLSEEEVQRVLEHLPQHHLQIANYNSFRQFVVAGKAENVLAAQSAFLDVGARRYVPLKVSGAFHTPALLQASLAFAEFLRPFAFRPPEIPVIANLTASPYPEHAVAEYLARQLMQPVQWTRTIESLLQQGEQDFVECGAKKILSPLIAAIKKGPEGP